MHRAIAIFVALGPACVQQQPCDGNLPVDGVVLDVHVASEDIEIEAVSGTAAPITSDEAWVTAVAEWGTDGGLDPDFSEEAVLLHSWGRPACGLEIDYFAWRWEDTAGVRAERIEDGDVCDLVYGVLDLVLVELDGATEVGWCE